MDSRDSSGGPSPQPNLPPGFRFHPTDEELVVHYLKRKASSAPLPVSIIAEVDLYKFDPWELPAKASFGEQEWYFFSPRDRKYPNGARPNRAATSGYWKATGTDKPVLASEGNHKVGVKKALVFYSGKPPKGVKSDWIMHEYRLLDNKPTNNRPPGYDFGNKKNSLRLDDWVLCRIYQKNNGSNRHMDNNSTEKDHEMIDYIFRKIPPMAVSNYNNNVSRMNLFPGIYSNNGGHDQLGLYHEAGLMNNNGDDDVMMSSLKRHLPVPYWPVVTAEEENIDVSPSKRFQYGDCSNVMTETTTTQTEIMGDGIYRTASYQLPGVNWYPS